MSYFKNRFIRDSTLRLSSIFPGTRQYESKPVLGSLQMQGGLGNQLACLFAAIYSCLAYESDILLDISHLQHHKGDFNNTFLGFSFIDCGTNGDDLAQIFFSRRDTCLCKRTLWKSCSTRVENVSAIDSGFVGPLPMSHKKLHYCGDFQSFLYHYLLTNGYQLALGSKPKFPSRAYNFIREELSVGNTVGIHVRRGDYLKNPSVWGILGQNYYNHAVSGIDPDSINTILISSDDKNLELPFLHKKFPKDNVIKLRDFPILSAVESHSLFGLCVYQVLANSSFSWSAAVMSESKHVFYPSPWFATRSNFSHQFPAHWKAIQSNF
jgi:hypothetical protein